MVNNGVIAHHYLVLYVRIFRYLLTIRLTSLNFGSGTKLLESSFCRWAHLLSVVVRFIYSGMLLIYIAVKYHSDKRWRNISTGIRFMCHTALLFFISAASKLLSSCPAVYAASYPYPSWSHLFKSNRERLSSSHGHLHCFCEFNKHD